MTRAARPPVLHEGVAALAAQASDFASSRPGPPWLQKLRRNGLAASSGSGSRRRTTRSGDSRTSRHSPARIRASSRRRLPRRADRGAREWRRGSGRSGSRLEPRLAFVNGRRLRRNVGASRRGLLRMDGNGPPGIAGARREGPRRSVAAEADSAGQFSPSLGTPFSTTAPSFASRAGVRLEEPLFILHVATPPAPRKRPEWCTRGISSPSKKIPPPR